MRHETVGRLNDDGGDRRRNMRNRRRRKRGGSNRRRRNMRGILNRMAIENVRITIMR